VNYRNVEQIREQTARGRGTQLWTVVLTAIAVSSLVVAGLVTLSNRRPPKTATRDPLAEIAQKQRASRPATDEKDAITFPHVLSDADRPTAPMAAVAETRGSMLTAASAPIPQPSASSMIGLGQPLPAGDLLHTTTVTREPKDELTQLALEASQPRVDGPLAEAGHDGGFQIQVASFRGSEEAESFVTELRRRSHRAYRQPAYVPDRGLWHRVRIGPFKTKLEATAYKNQLEKSERILGFVIDPEREKKPRNDAESGLSSREVKKSNHPGT